MEDPYKVLEISIHATSEEIKKAFRRLALKYHPDKNEGDLNAENRFKSISSAYNILSDVDKKKRYDDSINKIKTENNEVITPAYVLEKLTALRKGVTDMPKHKVNPLAIFKVLYDLFNDANVNLLLTINDRNKNREITHEAIICCKYMTYYLVKPFIPILIKLGGADNSELKEIISRQKRRKAIVLFQKYKYVGVMVIFVLFFLWSKNKEDGNKTQNNRPDNGNLYEQDANQKVEMSKHNFEPLNYIDIETGRYVNPKEKLYSLYVTLNGKKEYKFPYSQFKKRYGNDEGMLELYKKQKEKKRYINNFEQFKNDYSFLPLGEDYTLGKSTKQSAIKKTKSNDIQNLEGWDKVDLTNGSSPDCYNYEPEYDYSLDNKLEVTVGANTDVVLKLINAKTKKCIRYVYIRSNSIFTLRNIPEGKYYTKIAYGFDWRQKIENGKCIGRFARNSLYKRGERNMDFNKIDRGITRKGESEFTNYDIPSFKLSLNVIQTDFDSDSFSTNSINENEFNE